ncbi:ribbon-helix-helix protein, CopG family [Psychrobacter submarinus]|uniref:ribbon-helix-helix protein, CopG family n=1 Tax=Psychrobacter submarinus TaxID=154108 RepID=UPI001918B575|nr:ribbon-helix-helix protein, CopG family [Psychrobacter submarinus]
MTNKKDDLALINFKCDRDLADQFKKVVKEQGYSQSLVLRELMKEYLKKNAEIEPLDK